jgi:uroporphyrinogen decarboxylase
LISPRHFEKFSLPFYRRFCRHFAGNEVLIYLHICGNSSPILEMMADSGAHCVEPLDTMAGVSVADAKQRIGKRVTLMGGVHTRILAEATPGEVAAEAVRCCLEGGPERYILASADMIPPATPLANLRAMVEVAQRSLWREAAE